MDFLIRKNLTILGQMLARKHSDETDPRTQATPQGDLSFGMPNLHEAQHVGPRSSDLNGSKAFLLANKSPEGKSLNRNPGANLQVEI